jgi:hypothetical protein
LFVCSEYPWLWIYVKVPQYAENVRLDQKYQD